MSHSRVKRGGSTNELLLDLNTDELQSLRGRGQSEYGPDAMNPIFTDMGKQFIKFKSKSLSLIKGGNGIKYDNHFTVNYCTGQEDIEGILVVHNDQIVFINTIKDRRKRNVFRRFINLFKKGKPAPYKTFGPFEAVISVQHIAEINISTFTLPSRDPKLMGQKTHILQLLLYNHGEFGLCENINAAIGDLQGQKKPYANVYFSITPNNLKSCEFRDSDGVLEKLKARILQAQNDYRVVLRSSTKTSLPYFELYSDNFSPQYKKHLNKAKQSIKENVRRTILGENSSSLFIFGNSPSPTSELRDNLSLVTKTSSAAVDHIPEPVPMKKRRRLVSPFLVDESKIATAYQMAQIITAIPDLYHYMEWQLLYSSAVHGISYNNMCRRAKHANPFLIIIKDYHGNVFGAYGGDELKFSRSYYGGGETFLFTFKDTDEITAYHWTKKNTFFIHSTDTGIEFGASPFYGLWIGPELTRGRTNHSETFDNEPLASEDFEIKTIEFWSIVDPFAKR